MIYVNYVADKKIGILCFAWSKTVNTQAVAVMYYVFPFVEHDFFQEKETEYVLEKLNKDSTFCTREWLNSRGMVVQEGLENNIFTTLSKAFGEAAQEEVKKELKEVRW